MASIDAERDLLSTLRSMVESGIESAVPDRDPPELYEPARYVMQAPGKRLRPTLTLLSAKLHGGTIEAAMPSALSVELFHNFTLVHDDIMDQADTRRGRETVHVRWDEPTAVLVGDLLFGLAYEHLSRSAAELLPGLLGFLNESVHAVCAGQALDMVFEGREEVTVADYLAMIDRKTGALLSCALQLGAHSAGASKGDVGRMQQLGIDLGRAFQIQDDLLDLTAEDARWGKRVGGDILEGKRTYLLLSAHARAEGEDARFFDRVLQGDATSDDILPARDRMRRLGVLDDAKNAVEQYSDAATVRLGAFPSSDDRAALLTVVEMLRERAH